MNVRSPEAINKVIKAREAASGGMGVMVPNGRFECTAVSASAARVHDLFVCTC